MLHPLALLGIGIPHSLFVLSHVFERIIAVPKLSAHAHGISSQPRQRHSSQGLTGLGI
jgi:hypothetical protein